MSLRFLIGSLIFISIDIYAFQSVRAVSHRHGIYWLYWGATAFFYATALYVFLAFDRAQENGIIQLAAALFALLYTPKIILIIGLVIQDISRLFISIYHSVGAHGTPDFFPSRRRFINQICIGLAAIPFVAVIHGIIWGKYHYRVIKKTLHFDDLPEAFDGLTITQISDIHSGSFTDREKVEQAVNRVNEQGSDLIFFTGDLVNNRAAEMLPWIPTFKKLRAPLGIYATLGNHDYGDYIGWPSPEAKAKNGKLLRDIHAQLGFDLLDNENRQIERGGQKINVIGVENWGEKPFQQFGDLDKATQGIAAGEFNLLLSHDPTHFDRKVKSFPKKIHLTFSGHTHGMQFGIEIPSWGIKWSPIQYRYPKWAGLYEEGGSYLYVNRGFGYLAFPGRVGEWPEITVIELKKSRGSA